MRRILMFLGVISLALAELGLTATTAHAAPPYGANKWALLIGTDKFVKGNPTHSNVGSREDAESAYKLLTQKGWPADHIRLLVDQQATQAAIRDGFKWLQSNTNDNSFTVFHYSGHVRQAATGDKKHRVTHEYLWPADASSRATGKYISDDELIANIRAIRGWRWVDISGCEAAGFNDGLAASNILFTASSQVTEKSYEDPSWHHSIFSGLMIENGWLGGAADGDQDGNIPIQEAWNFAAQNAPKITANQGCDRKGRNCKPQHPSMAGGAGSNWLLDPPPPPPPPPPPKPAKKCTVKYGGVCL